jgi:methionyl-tRNA formyltransferase
MRIVFMGTPDFSVPTLESLIESKHEIVAVVTQPDKAKGRGGKMTFPPVKEAAIKAGLTVYQPERVRNEEFVETLRTLNPDVIIVIAFGQILPKSVIEMPKYGCINIHASLLPKYRGAAPIQWSIIDGEKETGVTIMAMDEGLDTGDILEVGIVKIAEDETGGGLFDKLSYAGGPLLLETLDKLENGTATRIPQDDSISTYAKKLDKQTGNIDFNMSAVAIERLVRGLNPWPSAYTRLDGKTLKIWKAEVVKEEATQKKDLKEAKPGQIIAVSKDEIYVATGEGILSIKELQLEGKKRMTTDAFLRGYNIDLSKEVILC